MLEEMNSRVFLGRNRHEEEHGMYGDEFHAGTGMDCSDVTEKKGDFSYLPWSDAVEKAKTICPGINWRLVPNEAGKFLHSQSEMSGFFVIMQCWGAHFDPVELIYPVLDHRNNPIESPTCMDLNNAQQRGLAKVIAIATGIGLYLFQGEDVPEAVREEQNKEHELVVADLHETLKEFDEATRKKVLEYHKNSGWVLAAMKKDLAKMKKAIKARVEEEPDDDQQDEGAA